jgi:hypothetical protein
LYFQEFHNIKEVVMAVYIEYPDGTIGLHSPDYSEGELEKLREQLDKASVKEPIEPTRSIQQTLNEEI